MTEDEQVEYADGLDAPLLEQAGHSSADYSTENVIVRVEEQGQPSWSNLGTTHWLLTTAIMLSDMFGLGTLSLPADFARLGWIPALACLAWFAAADVYAGTVYQRLSIKIPSAVVFDEIGYAAMGRWGSALVYATIYSSILLQPIMLHLTCMETLRQTLYMYNISQELACLIVTVMIIPLGQMHHIEDVAWVSILGTVGMLGAMLIVAGKLLMMYFTTTAAAAAPTELVAHGQGLHSGIVGAMDIAFAFGGQINWMRYITTMKKRNKFSSAVSITAVFMTLVYVMVAVTGYSAFGTAIDLHKPISSVVGQDGWTVAMNAGVFLHCIIAYQVNVNVWCSLLLHIAMPKHAKELTVTNSISKRGLWLLVTVICIALAALVAYTLPFFSIVMAVIASLGDVLSMFGLPCLFALYLLPMRRWESGMCRVLVVMATALSGLGMYSSIQQLIEAYQGKS